MIEKITLRIFWTMMLLCAGNTLVAFWTPEPAEFQMKISATLFIIGFAAFLIWAPTITYRFYQVLEK